MNTKVLVTSLDSFRYVSAVTIFLNNFIYLYLKQFQEKARHHLDLSFSLLITKAAIGVSSRFTNLPIPSIYTICLVVVRNGITSSANQRLRNKLT